MDTINAEFQAIIDKNLPFQVGEILKKRLQQAEIDAGMVKTQDSMLLKKDENIKGLEKIINDYKSLDSRNAAIETREKAVDLKERQMEVEKLKHELSCSNMRGNDIKELVGILVKNPMAIDLMKSNTSIPIKNQYGGTDYATENRNEIHIKGHTKGNADQYTPESEIS